MRTIFLGAAMVLLFGIVSQNGSAAPWKSGQTFRDCADCSEMVVIPGGSFSMGSPVGEPGRYPEEGPQRHIDIRQFAIGKYDVTREEWTAFVKATKRETPEGCDWSGLPDKDKSKASWQNLGFPQAGNHPVVCVTWNDAQDYVGWLSKRTGLKYRLPTEAEWEYSARAGSNTAFPWGTQANHDAANYGAEKGFEGVASGRDKWVYTSPVDAFPSNAFGLYDMNGNVLQWMQDCFVSSYAAFPADGSAYQTAMTLQAAPDPGMVGTDSCAYRMVRGGDWADPPDMIRSAARSWAPTLGSTLATYRSAGVGFRVARTLD